MLCVWDTYACNGRTGCKACWGRKGARYRTVSGSGDKNDACIVLALDGVKERLTVTATSPVQDAQRIKVGKCHSEARYQGKVTCA